MATSHPRVGVTKDADLAAALDSTRALLDERLSEAGHVRRLALIGADALRRGTPEARAALERERIRARPGVRAATHRLEELPWLDEERVDGERGASRALEWARGGR